MAWRMRIAPLMLAVLARFVSSGIVRLPNGLRAAEIVDPDGHALVIEE